MQQTPILPVYSPQKSPLGDYSKLDSFLTTSPLRYSRNKTFLERLYQKDQTLDERIANTVIFKFIDRLVEHSKDLESPQQSKFNSMLKALEILATKNKISIFDFLISLHDHFFDLPAVSFQAMADIVGLVTTSIRKSTAELKEIIFNELNTLTQRQLEYLTKTDFGKELLKTRNIGKNENSSKFFAIDFCKDQQEVVLRLANILMKKMANRGDNQSASKFGKKLASRIKDIVAPGLVELDAKQAFLIQQLEEIILTENL